jgi:hypothetical protein
VAASNAPAFGDGSSSGFADVRRLPMRRTIPKLFELEAATYGCLHLYKLALESAWTGRESKRKKKVETRFGEG